MPTYMAGEEPMEKRPERKAKKIMDHIRIKPRMGGGHRVEMHFDNSHMGPMHEPSGKEFGPEEGGEALAHVGKLMGIPAAEEEAGEEEHMKEG